MKKQNFSKLIAATVATSAIVVPTAALAADTTTAQSGVYFAAQGKFYTFDQLAGIPIAELSLLLTDNSKVFIYTAGVGTASLTQIAASNGSYITAANLNGNTANPEKVIPSGVYTDKNNNKITLTGNTSPVGDLKVESVSAINAKTLTVTFNQAVKASDNLNQIVVLAPNGQEVVGTATAPVAVGATSATYAFSAELSQTGTYTVKGTSAKADYVTAIETVNAGLNADNSVKVSGTTILADRVEVSYDGVNFVDASVTPQGAYTYTTPVLSTGAKTITVRATKGAVSVTKTTSVSVPTPAQAAVISAEAINPHEIKVTFNQEVEKTSAELVANYTTEVGAVAVTPNKVTLSADKKSVIITLAVAVADKSSYQVKKIANVLTATSNQKMAEYKGDAKIFNNTVGPKLLSVTKTVDNKFVLTFDKHVTNVATIKIDNVALVGTNTVTAPVADKAGLYTLTTAVVTDAALLAAGTHAIVVNNATDLGAVVTTVQQSTFTLSTDTTAPTVSSISPVGNNSFDIKFSERITDNAGVTLANLETLITAGNFEVKKGNFVYPKTFAGAALDGYVSSTLVLGTTDTYRVVVNPKVVVGSPTVTYDLYDANATTTQLAVSVKGYQDAAGLIGAATTQNVTLTKDAVKPSVVATNLNSFSATDTLNIKFNKALSATASDLVASKIAVYDQNNVRLDLAAVAPVTITGTGTDFLTLKLAGAPATAAQQFKVVIEGAAVKDLSGNANDALTTYVDNRAAATIDTPVAVSVTTEKNVITVTYGQEMSDSAITAANYKLDAGALPQGTKIDFLDVTKKVVRITLPTNIYTVGSTATLELSKSIVSKDGSKYVATAAGDKIFTASVTLSDNIKPILSGAKWVAATTDTTSKTLELTFSENLAAVVDGATTQDDLVVIIGGAEYTVAKVIDTNTGDKVLRIEIANAVNVSNTLQVKVVAESADGVTKVVNIVDTATDAAGTAAGNKLTTGTTVTVTGTVAP